jgi:hypothetical protein
MYQVLKDFAGPVATIVASPSAVYVTAHFAQRQAWLAKEKLRYDLFDRRLNIFISIFDFYHAMISWSGSPEQIAARERFFRAYQEAHFLFKKESGIVPLLKDLNDQGAKVIGFKEHGDNLKVDRDLCMRTFMETQEIQTSYFESALTKLRDAVSKYLNFHDI